MLFASLCSTADGQNVLAEIDHDERHVQDRLFILSGSDAAWLHSSIYPYQRGDLVRLAKAYYGMEHSVIGQYYIRNILDQNNEFLRDEPEGDDVVRYSDSTRTFYYLQDTAIYPSYNKSRKPFLKVFYRTPAHFYEVDEKDFYLRVNPMIRFGIGRESSENVTTFINQRGINIRGGVGRNVFFQTSFYDTQMRYPNYVNDFTAEFGVVPGAGLYKNYESSIFDFTLGRDYLLANAFAGVNFGEYLGIQLGHHQHFIGDGIRSLFLSDFSTPFFSLKINTRIWKLHYQNIFAELAADDFTSAVRPGDAIPKKYFAAHYLSFKPAYNLSIGLYEAVVFNRPGHQFELQYLNPVILYRTVEGSIGSPDNVLLGLNARYDWKKAVSLYGQFILDDISFREIFNGNNGWWGNKYGYQLGLKYINAFGMDDIDLQAELNHVRPYTYSHYDENANYSHYKQALAHPLGANFKELIFSLHYRITPKLALQSAVFLIQKGEDGTDSISQGGNILLPNTLRPGDYDHNTGQGIATDIFFWSSVLSYHISPGLIADIQYISREKESAAAARNSKTNLLQASIRLNIARRDEVF